ncbi:prolipoprotein diacylglyceryl transferase [Stigmatella aurantiaca]|uniref:Phosphatidylglycerol--prolipoprotein diacylglyceryl transferase n=1 Tax=Stigmatella aurantiaca (strain DW4/3-1) TaxID=378806 RepID=Q099Q3_STIAD|nr:prolipoprotein diacylglyceryl transferase family protein [Stigmatella aurantiaca]EAU68451.1 prolipoprotein diacylglyceryl transferase [Stigmatella aurantiaca DW4/3-1]
MLPILFRLSFESLWSQVLLYAAALALVGYIAFNGWRGATGAGTGPGPRAPATRGDRVQRAALFGGVGAVLAFYGLQYALPASAFPGGKGDGIPVHTYGVLLALGFLCAVSVAARLAQEEWRKPEWVDGRGFVDLEGPRRREQVLDLALWVLIGGLVGSRLLFILVNWKDYAGNWTSIFSLGGGLVFYGGLIGAAGAAYAFSRVHGLDFLRLADLAMPTVSLGQALGRLGCFSAGCCWGGTAGTHAPLAVRFPGGKVARDLFGHLTGNGSNAFHSQVKDARYVVEATGEVLHQAAPGAVRISEWAAQHGTTLPVHPTQLFESVGQTLLFVGLLALRRHRRFHGQIFAFWLMAYAVLRSTVELFRGDTERGTLHGLLSDNAPSLAHWVPLEAWYNVSTSQFISLCMFTFGATLLYQRSRRLSEAEGLGPTPSPA